MESTTEAKASEEKRLLEEENARLRREVEEYQQRINDLQAGMYINCVYCGHRYGPDTEVPTAMADVLKEHIKVCPKHPLSAANQRIEELEGYMQIYNHLSIAEIMDMLGLTWDEASDYLLAARAQLTGGEDG